MLSSSFVQARRPERNLDRARRAVLRLALLSSSFACATDRVEFATPGGTEDGDLLEEFDVLGIVKPRFDGMSGRGFHPQGFLLEHELEVPVGTEIVVPFLGGWYVGFEADIDRRVMDIGAYLGSPSIGAPDLTRSPTQTATLSTAHFLNDQSPGEEVGRRITPYALCLRRANGSTVAVPAQLLHPSSIVAFDRVSFRAASQTGARAVDGTTIALPRTSAEVAVCVQGWMIGYGAHEFPPAHLPGMAPFGVPDSDVDHNVHRTVMSVASAPIRPPDPMAAVPSPSVEVRSSMQLTDRRRDDPWFGAMDGSVLVIAPREGLRERLAIVGVSKRHTEIKNIAAGLSVAQELVELDAPADTDEVVVALRGWRLAFAHRALDGEPDPTRAHFREHQLGVGQASVELASIDPRDPARPRGLRRVRLMVTLQLRDRNGDDEWFGNVDYHVLFLSRRTD